MALHAVSPAAASSSPLRALSRRLPQRPGRLLLPSTLLPPASRACLAVAGGRVVSDGSHFKRSAVFASHEILCTSVWFTGCGCLAKPSTLIWSSTNFTTLQAATVDFVSWPLVLRHSDKRAVLTHATIEEIEAEKSVIEEQAKEKMEKAIETVQSNFNTVRTGRANPAMLDRIEVEYYGTPVNLKSIAQISTPDATSLLIQPYDKSSLKLIEKTIVAANLGVSTSNDGEVIRATVPPLTSDRRKELAKTVAKLAEEGKVAIRNIRRDAIKAYDKLQKEKKLSEDNVKDLSADLQKVTDEYMKKIEAIQKQKEQELMKI